MRSFLLLIAVGLFLGCGPVDEAKDEFRVWQPVVINSKSHPQPVKKREVVIFSWQFDGPDVL